MVNALCNRPAHYTAAVMVINPLNIGRKYCFVCFVNRHCKVCPPHEHLRLICAVVYLYLGFYIASALVNGDSHHTFQAVERFNFTRPYCLFAGFAFFNYGFKRHICCRTVVLRIVKFNSAGNPRSGKTYQSRLNNFVIVYEVIITDFVISAQNFTSFIRKYLRHNILVFNGIHIIFNIGFLIADAIGKRERVYSSACSLIWLFFEKHRQIHSFPWNICRYKLFFFFNIYGHKTTPFNNDIIKKILSLKGVGFKQKNFEFFRKKLSIDLSGMYYKRK